MKIKNWQKFIREAYIDDVISTLDDRQAPLERTKLAAKWKDNPPSTEADWEKFKQWKADVETSQHQKSSPEEYDKAIAQRPSKSLENIAFNCNELKKWLKGYEWRNAGTFSCNSLEEATQGMSEGQGSPSNIFKDHKVVKTVGEGGYGVAFLFSNDHIVKVFKSGVYGLKKELETYAKLLNSQVGGSARSHDLAVYEFGTLPMYVPNAERDMVEPIKYAGYAEIGKVIPFENWLDEYENEKDAKVIETFFDADIFNGMQDAATISYHLIAKAPDRKHDNEAARARRLGMTPEDVGLEPHNIKPFSMIEGGAEEYADYVIKWMQDKGLENNSQWVQKYGWAEGAQQAWNKATNQPDLLDMPAIPPVLQSGPGAKLLKDFLIAMYDLADSVGDQFIYGRLTRDVHLGNFGISYQTGEVVIFDR
jgi:hypothetical protein